VAALAARDGNTLTIMAWHYHDDDLPGPAAEVNLTLPNLPDGAHPTRARHFRIDENHSNAYTAWKRMGSPQQPTDEQYAQLEQSGQLAELEPLDVTRGDDGAATIRFTLPRQAVWLLVLDLAAENAPDSDAPDSASRLPQDSLHRRTGRFSDQLSQRDIHTTARKVEPVPQSLRKKLALDRYVRYDRRSQSATTASTALGECQ
jgi:hypothetical protein